MNVTKLSVNSIEPVSSNKSSKFLSLRKNNNKIVEVNKEKYKNNKNHMCPTFYFTINAVSKLQYVWYNKAA